MKMLYGVGAEAISLSPLGRIMAQEIQIREAGAEELDEQSKTW